MTEPRLRLVEPVHGDRVERVRNGDRQALEDLLTELAPKAHRWLFRLLGPRADLDDALQDALSELARSLPKFEGRSKVTTFAHRIVVRVGYRYMRHKTEQPLELVAPPPDHIDPESQAMSREALRRLHRVLERMPKKRRVAFALCAIEGVTPTEAAEILDVSAEVVRSRLKEARREVLRRLEHDPYFQAIAGGDHE